MRPRINNRREGLLCRTLQQFLTTRNTHRVIVTGLLCLSALMELSTLRLSHHRLNCALTDSDLQLDTIRALVLRERGAQSGQPQNVASSPSLSSQYYAFSYASRKSLRSWRDAKVDFFANNGFSQAVRTTAAMGEHIQRMNTTFLVYQGPHEDPYVVAYDHTTHAWIGPVHVGTSMLGDFTDPLVPVNAAYSSTAGADAWVGNNRGQPSLVVDSRGYLHVTYGGDGGDEEFDGRLVDGLNATRDDYGSGRVIHASSQQPYNIREWTTHTSRSGAPLSWRGSDCQFVKVATDDPSNDSQTSSSLSSSNVTLYHFCRHGFQAASITYQRSTDDGETWSVPVPILESQGVPEANNDEIGTDVVTSDGWSCRFRAGSELARHTIAAACSYHRFRTEPPDDTAAANSTEDDGNRAHLRQNRTSALPDLPADDDDDDGGAPIMLSSSYNVYYMELDTRSQTWRNVRGEALNSLPLSKERADALILALDTETPTGATSLKVDPSIRPVALALSRPGHPHLLIQAAVFTSTILPGTNDTSEGAQFHNPKKLWYVGWTGSSWADPAMVVSPDPGIYEYDEDGDLAVSVDNGGPEAILVTLSMTNRTHSVVQNFASLDQGRTWDRRTDDTGQCWVAIRNHHGRFHTSSYVLNGRPDARIIAYLEEPVTAQSNMAYRKMYLIGSNGPILRTRREAEVCRGVKTSEDGSMCGDWETTSAKLK